MKKYYITGVPGIGKTTILNELKKLGYAAFDVDYLPGVCQWVNRKTKEPVEFSSGGGQEWENENTWECSRFRLAEELDKLSGKAIFVSGIANNQVEYFDLFDKIFLLRADKEIFLNRMAGRDAEHFGFHEADRLSVLSWYEDFEVRTIKMRPVILDATLPIREIVDIILREIKDEIMKRDAVIIYLIKNRKVLLLLTRYPLDKLIWTGVSGYVDKGEEPIDAAVREASEELGVQLDARSLTFRRSLEMGDIKFSIYTAKEWQGEPASQEDSLTKLEWFDAGDLPLEQMFPTDRDWLPQLLKEAISSDKK